MAHRDEILKIANEMVSGNREEDYGRPERNFERIAALWSEYLGPERICEKIRPHDVAAMLALLKVARIASGHAKLDNWIDLAGYAACGGEIETEFYAVKSPGPMLDPRDRMATRGEEAVTYDPRR